MLKPLSRSAAILAAAAASSSRLIAAAAEQCDPIPTNVKCKDFPSWSAFSSAVKTATGTLILCSGTSLTKTAADKEATIKRSLTIACEQPRECTLSGPGRHINVKTLAQGVGLDSVVDTTLQGIRFVGADRTSVGVKDRSGGEHTFCDNEFVGNSRPMDWDQGGGAIKADLGTNVIIRSTTFRDNSANSGGAVSSSGFVTRIVDSVFESNVALKGGAIESIFSLEIGSTKFIDNSADTMSPNILLAGGTYWNDLGGNVASTSYGLCGNGFYDGSGECHAFTTPPWNPLPAATPPFVFSGNLYEDGDTGLHVAKGLVIESVARSGRSVQYRSSSGGSSGDCEFHYQPDGAATFYDASVNEDGGFHYCSNSELSSSGGGAYCLEFDADCNVKDYSKILGGKDNDGCGNPPGGHTTTWNCNGGATPWNTWVSCEEHNDGYCWQTDPYGKKEPQRITAIGQGEWEAMAADDRMPEKPVFYFTEDDSEGAVRQFIPSQLEDDPWDTLHGVGEVKYLVFCPKKNELYCDNNPDHTFFWSTYDWKGRESAQLNFQNVEGIIFMEIDGEGHVFFVSKALKMLFDLNLDKQTHTAHSTKSGLADGGSFLSQPDIITAIGTNFIWHTEDGGSTPGAYLKDLRTDEYYTIFQDNDPVDDGGEETTGIAISPNGRCMIGCLQERGECFTFKREDGGSLEHLGLRLRIR